MVEIMKGRAIHRFSAMQETKAMALLARKSTLPKPSRARNLLRMPNSVLNIPTRHSRMEM